MNLAHSHIHTGKSCMHAQTSTLCILVSFLHTQFPLVKYKLKFPHLFISSNSSGCITAEVSLRELPHHRAMSLLALPRIRIITGTLISVWQMDRMKQRTRGATSHMKGLIKITAPCHLYWTAIAAAAEQKNGRLLNLHRSEHSWRSEKCFVLFKLMDRMRIGILLHYS